MSKQIPLVIGVGAVAVTLGYFAVAWRHNEALSSNFQSIAPGTGMDVVLSALGPPDAIRQGCRDKPTWLDQPVTEACAVELQYDARLLPKFWTVGFNEQDRAIAKYEYTSP